MRFFISLQKEQRWCAESDEHAFGSVSEIQSGWFVLGMNGKFALDADSLWCLFVESMLRTILIRRVHGSSLALHQAESSCGRGRPRGRRAMPT